MGSTWFVRLDQTLSSYSILAVLLAVVLLVVVLERSGILGWALEQFGRTTRSAIHTGFWLWELCLSWAEWWTILVAAIALITVGALAASTAPPLTLLCSILTMSIGVATCLAYMCIDIERYEVERGRKAVHNPSKGQELAANVARYGHQVEITLLGVAAAAVIGGFALLNQGLYEGVGRNWYRIESDAHPVYVDFFASALINLLSLVDVLDLADSRQLIHAAFVRKGGWQVATLLAVFRSFFTMIILQQVFASMRQGRLLSETIADFWSPHETLYDRARNALPQFGAAAIGPILNSLRKTTSLTKEQRDRLPAILAAIGPSTIPLLMRHLQDSHDHVRSVVAGTLGQLGARNAIEGIATLIADPSDFVRLSAVEALGSIAVSGVRTRRPRLLRLRGRGWRWRSEVTEKEATAHAVSILRQGLKDSQAAIRGASAKALGQVGPVARDAADLLADLLHDSDEGVRCQAAEALGQVGGSPELLEPLLTDASAAVRAAAARGVKSLGKRAAACTPTLIKLLQDQDETVRTAASEAVTAAGPLDDEATQTLVAGLSSPDNVVRAQTAEALGSVDAPAESAAPPLVEALSDDNDVVRAKAVEALAKIGEAAANVAVPSLVRALNDRDSWVSALAAEALGEMGAGREAVRGLVRALSHVNPHVRAKSAEALGKLGPSAALPRKALERAAQDEDGSVRSEALRALGALGPPERETLALIKSAIADSDPLVRAAAASAVGAWDDPPEELLRELLPLLSDPNEQVKVEVCEALSRPTGVIQPVVEGLCQVLISENSPVVQAAAALALGGIGADAKDAGPTLLKLLQTGEATVREQAMRALVLIQPADGVEGFILGMSDPISPVRLVASAAWFKAPVVPPTAAPALIEGLRDSETRVRSNAAYALARLDELPGDAVPLLQECMSEADDGLRLNAALALRLAPFPVVADLMRQLLDDPNVRVRLVAAGAILAQDPSHSRAVAVVQTAANDPTPRVRQACDELLTLIPPTGPEDPAIVADPALDPSPAMSQA
jgi:HEAT repeat protein